MPPEQDAAAILRELAQRCAEARAWQKTGLLANGALRELATTMVHTEEHQRLMAAERKTADDAMDLVIALASGQQREPHCAKCTGAMKPGIAIAQTYSSGAPDFPGDNVGVTMSPGGPGALMDCMKCEACGWSVTAGQRRENELQTAIEEALASLDCGKPARAELTLMDALSRRAPEAGQQEKK